jgi:hypothetical protein
MLDYLILVFYMQMIQRNGTKNPFEGYIAVCCIVEMYFLSLLFILSSFTIIFFHWSIFEFVSFGSGYINGKIKGLVLGLPVLVGVYFYYFFNKKKIQNRIDEFDKETEVSIKKIKKKMYFFVAFSFVFMIGVMLLSVYLERKITN